MEASINQATIENVPTKPPATPTNAATDAQNSGSRSSFAGGTSRVGSLVATVASTADSLLKPRAEAPTALSIHPSACKSCCAEDLPSL